MRRSSICFVRALDGLPLRVPNESLPFFIPFLEGVAKAALSCAHRTSTVSSCAFCEQEGHMATSFPEFSLFPLHLGGGLRLSSTARVERGPSVGARSASTEDIGGRPLFPLLMGNTFQPPDSVNSAPRWNRPDPTNATSTACQSPARRCTVRCRRSAKERSRIFRQWDARSKPVSPCWQTRMSHCA